MSVEKLPAPKFAKIELRQDALGSIFSGRLDIFYPPKLGCLGRKESFSTDTPDYNSYSQISARLVSNLYVIRRLLVAVTLAALIVCGSVFWYLHFLAKRARFIAETAYELAQARQTPTVKDIRQRFGDVRPDQCVGSECSYTVSVSNRILALLHLVPYTELQSYFWTRDGVILENMLNYTTTVNREHRIVSHVQIDFCGCREIAVHPWDATSPLDTNGLVQIGNSSSLQSLSTAVSLDENCFTKYKGCQSVADLLPTVWKQTSEMKIACLLPNDKGWVEKPTDWP